MTANVEMMEVADLMNLPHIPDLNPEGAATRISEASSHAGSPLLQRISRPEPAHLSLDTFHCDYSSGLPSISELSLDECCIPHEARAPARSRKMASKTTRIVILLCIDVAFFLLELVVGYAVHSLALVADAFHMLNDVLSLCVGLWAVRIATKGSTKMYTYGVSIPPLDRASSTSPNCESSGKELRRLVLWSMASSLWPCASRSSLKLFSVSSNHKSCPIQSSS